MKYFKIKALLHGLFNTEQATSKVKLLANRTVMFFASVDRNFRRKENKQNESNIQINNLQTWFFRIR